LASTTTPDVNENHSQQHDSILTLENHDSILTAVLTLEIRGAFSAVNG
jgi:hypothetical protein